MKWIRGHEFTIAAILLMVALMGYVAYLGHVRDTERIQRKAQVNGLACALSTYLGIAAGVYVANPFPGSALLGDATHEVIAAAIMLGGPCPKED